MPPWDTTSADIRQPHKRHEWKGGQWTMEAVVMMSLNWYGNQEKWPEEGRTRENRMKGHQNAERWLLVGYCWKGNERTLVRLKYEQQYLQSKRAKKRNANRSNASKELSGSVVIETRKKDGHCQLHGYIPIWWIMIVKSLLTLNLHHSWINNKLSWTNSAAHCELIYNPVKSTVVSDWWCLYMHGSSRYRQRGIRHGMDHHVT